MNVQELANQLAQYAADGFGHQEVQVLDEDGVTHDVISVDREDFADEVVLKVEMN